MNDSLTVDCAEWREVAEIFPVEMEVIMNMMIDAEFEVCS